MKKDWKHIQSASTCSLQGMQDCMQARWVLVCNADLFMLKIPAEGKRRKSETKVADQHKHNYYVKRNADF